MIEINLINRDSDLESIAKRIENHRLTINEYWEKLKRNKKVELNKICETRENILDLLYVLADYTIPIFDLREPIEEYYQMTYSDDPEMAKMMWLQFYGGLHEKFDVHKDECFFLLNTLERYELDLNRVNRKSGEVKLLKKILI